MSNLLKDSAKALFWHPTKNSKIALDKISANSEIKIWWQCDKGHEWEQQPKHRRENAPCPTCLKESKSLTFLIPEVIKLWNKKRNEDSLLTELTPSSSQKVWWFNEKCGHEWLRSISGQRKNTNCPYCSGRKVLKGFNDLATTHPQIAKEWHPVKNESLFSSDVTAGSGKKVWWQCDEGHEWQTAVGTRTNLKAGCAECYWARSSIQNSKPNGKPALDITHPEIAAQWHPKHNGTFTPSDVLYGSDKKVWWQCDKGHEYEAPVSKRTISKRNCPTCSGRKISIGFNDLKTVAPHLEKEWHPTKNSLTIEQVTVQSAYEVVWICEKGHEWEAPVYNRTGNNPSGCPICSRHVSQPEIEIFNYLKTLNLNVKRRDRTVIAPLEVDLYIEEKQLAIEFNGLYWHSEANGKHRNYHYNKWLACKEKNIQLIQIWEDDWNRNPTLIKNMLAHKLRVNSSTATYARNTLIKELTQNEINIFLNENHIQGATDGSIRLGLYSKNNPDYLLACLLLKTNANTQGKELNLLRYSTSLPVIGGFTKLLKAVELRYKPQRIVTFSDNTVSDGGLYETTGFIADKQLPPDYMYIVKNNREHKFSYRKARFQRDNNLKYESGMTEKELAELNNIKRIWDAGKTRWVKNYV